MKKAILLIFASISYIISAAGYYSDIGIMDHSCLGNNMYIEAGKNTFAYNISLLKGIEAGNYSLIAGVYSDIYDNIEITDIPDSTQSPSPVNVPFITDNINVLSLTVPLSLIFRKEHVSIGLTERPSYIYLYTDHYFTNSIDVFASLRNDQFYCFTMIRNITKTLGINSDGLNMYQTPEIIMRFAVPGNISSVLFIEGGVELLAGRNDTRDYQMDYYLYGISRSLFFDAKLNRLLFGANVLGGNNALYVGYDSGDYSVIVSFIYGIISSFKLSAGINL